MPALSLLQGLAMQPHIHAASVPVFKQMLGALGEVLAKAEAHATARNIEPAALLQARLFPDMFALVRQVQVACDFASGVSARLAGAEVPSYEATEQSFADLQARIAKTLAFIQTLPEAAFEGAEAKTITVKAGPRELTFPAPFYLNSYALPNFYFHLTTAYNILRGNGVEIGKVDFLGG
jgi:hypothetical protein